MIPCLTAGVRGALSLSLSVAIPGTAYRSPPASSGSVPPVAAQELLLAVYCGKQNIASKRLTSATRPSNMEGLAGLLENYSRLSATTKPDELIGA